MPNTISLHITDRRSINAHEKAQRTILLNRLQALSNSRSQFVVSQDSNVSALKNLGDGSLLIFNQASNAADLLQSILAVYWTLKVVITSKTGLVVSGYVLKKISDECWNWLKSQMKTGKEIKTIELYGPDNRLLKTISTLKPRRRK
jgi:hypothetical protein